MTRYRQALPQLDGNLFISDGGIETTLMFHEGLELPGFASFVLLKTAEGRATLRKYFRTHAAIARDHGCGFVLESATWRSNPDWGRKLGYPEQALVAANRDAITLVGEIRDEFETADSPMVISGCLGPRGDGYRADARMSADQAQQYHAAQVEVFREAGADLVSAITMTYAEEAIGITRAAQAAGMPAVIAFTTETDGRLPSGQPLADAIAQVDRITGNGPAYYMINCAHPTHFQDALAAGEPWTLRIRGLRANASRRSHAELDESTDLDDGDPQELGAQYRALRDVHRHFNVFGGCCGTDHRHIDAIARACRLH